MPMLKKGRPSLYSLCMCMDDNCIFCSFSCSIFNRPNLMVFTENVSVA